MKVTVNKSPHTGQLFESNTDYRRHMRDQQRRQRDQLDRQLTQPAFDKLVEELHGLPDVNQISEFIQRHYWLIANQTGFRCNMWKNPRFKFRKPGPEDRVLLEISDLKFKEIPTIRSAPHGQPTTGYNNTAFRPYTEWGWSGRIEISFEGEAYEFFETNQLRPLGIITGSGGGGPRGINLEISMFAKDFQALRRAEVMMKLSKQAPQVGPS